MAGEEPLMAAPVRFYRAKGEFGYLSNLYPAVIFFEGRSFKTAEHAYQYGKPKDPEVREWIVAAPTARLVAMTAHALLPYDVVPDWKFLKVNRMRRVLEAKFGQNAGLAAKLVQTGDAPLIEASKTDPFWGEGPTGRGKNTLGMLLEQTRDNLRTGPFAALRLTSEEIQKVGDHA